MEPVLVFFGIAALAGCVFRGISALRLRSAERRSDATEGEICSLQQANRITSVAVVASLAALALAGAAYLVL